MNATTTTRCPESRISLLAAAAVVALLAAGGFFGGWQVNASRTVSVAAAPVRAVRHVEPASANRAPASWEERWRGELGRAAGPARNQAACALIEELARRDPKRALDLALAEPNWYLREQLRNAALRGWGATAPDATADWCMQHRLDVRMACFEAMFAGAAEHPAEAVRVALRVCAADPGPAADYGHALIAALAEKAGDFESAAKFATELKTEKQSFLLDSAFHQWAQHRPEEALAALGRLTDEKTRSAALDGVLDGWASSDARALAAYAQTLPVGDERSRALTRALPAWVQKDPSAAMAWIGAAEPGPELDAGIIAVSELPTWTEKPGAALGWLDNVSDGAKRLMSKHAIFSQWVSRSPAEARRFAEAVRNPADRAMMFDVLAEASGG